jgi:hypothetical protein
MFPAAPVEEVERLRGVVDLRAQVAEISGQRLTLAADVVPGDAKRGQWR